MAWKLRQSVEGDRIVSVQNVANDATGFCWSNANGQYIPGTIAIKIDNIEYVLNSVASLAYGFLFITVPNNIYIKANTKVQVYAKCTNNPEYITSILPAKAVNFQLTNSVITTCSYGIELNALVDEYIRIFLGVSQGNYSLITIDSTNMANQPIKREDYEFQPGDSGNISILNGTIQRTVLGTENSTLFSKIPYKSITSLQINPVSQLYHTIRLGNIELIFDHPNVRYINYTSTNNTEIYLTTYNIGDRFNFVSTNQNYYVYKNENFTSPIINIPKNITWTVSGGMITPVTGLLGNPVQWDNPRGAGDYEIIVTLNQNIKYSKTLTLHSCGTAVNDFFSGAINTPFIGNVSTNDKLCEGEANLVALTGGTAITGGIVSNLSADGTFTFIPNEDFQGTASFQYTRLCGGTNGIYENVGQATVNIEFACPSILPEWVDANTIECINCVPHKYQIDLNKVCSKSIGYRWITDNNNSCNYNDQWEDTNETKCKYSHKWRKQINLNDCDSKNQERWIDLGVSVDCDCIGEVFINSCCSKGEYYPVIKLLNNPTEPNRAINKCLLPDLGETCLVNKSLKFKSLNDSQPQDYLITIFDCNQKVISQTKLLGFNCSGETTSVIPIPEQFPYSLPFILK